MPEFPALPEDELWMQRAIVCAEHAARAGEVPVGAMIVQNGQCIVEAGNAPIALSDPTAHAEIQALRQAGQVQRNYRLVDCTLYVTLEPCIMCVGALIHARVVRVVFGASDPRTGALTSVFTLGDSPQLNHQLSWTKGVLAAPCAALLKEFFKVRR